MINRQESVLLETIKRDHKKVVIWLYIPLYQLKAVVASVSRRGFGIFFNA